ncbi:hypothetical protein B0T18DRAFT_402079 [Schizothecium vesticola]|uniref:Secreted protein n=1 Tax=Schizothecium vesticola TaxID=314040 RepID=A0AA40KAB3_9PEZI|nr:hypothetical protein B0T18DRAFT_402079 [Schizothecium vesticola]
MQISFSTTCLGVLGLFIPPATLETAQRVLKMKCDPTQLPRTGHYGSVPANEIRLSRSNNKFELDSFARQTCTSSALH